MSAGGCGKVWCRVRKSRQKEAAGAAVLMQIEWSEAEGLKLAGVVNSAGVAAGGPAQGGVDGRSEPRRGQEEVVRRQRRHTSARRSEGRRQCGVWARDFMQPWSGGVENGVGVVRL